MKPVWNVIQNYEGCYFRPEELNNKYDGQVCLLLLKLLVSIVVDQTGNATPRESKLC